MNSLYATSGVTQLWIIVLKKIGNRRGEKGKVKTLEKVFIHLALHFH